MNIAYLLSRAAQRWPTAPAVYEDLDQIHDFRQFDQLVSHNADCLHKRAGLNPGDRIGIFAENSATYMVWVWSIWRAGLTAVLINARLHPKEAVYILSDSGSKACFIESGAGQALQDALADTYPQFNCTFYSLDAEAAKLDPVEPCKESFPDANADIAQLFYTSGTTGRPKGVMITHENLRQMLLNFSAEVCRIEPGHHQLHFAPLSHAAGMFGYYYTVCGAASVVLRRMGFDDIESLLEAFPDTGTFMPPTMVRRLLDKPAFSKKAVTNLNTILYAGGPMYLADIQQATARFANRFVQVYGQGESPMTITCLSRTDISAAVACNDDDLLASVGFPFKGVEVDVVNDSGKTVPRGEIGEVVVRGPTVMRGYWNKPESTAQTIRGDWLYTGDMGSFDARGFLTLKDRSKDLVISGGMNVYPREIEEVLLHHDEVDEVAVVGKPDRDWGEIVVAFVKASSANDIHSLENKLDALCLANLARFKRPKQYVFVDTMPKNNYGKILKRELRTSFNQPGATL